MVMVTSCHYPVISQEETISIPTEQQIVEEVVLEPTPSPTPFVAVREVKEDEPVEEILEETDVQKEPKKEVISFTGFYENVTVESEYISDWHRSFFKNLRIVECTDCSSEQILEFLEPENGEWVIVQDGRVLYTHSGWPLLTGPNFGQIFNIVRKENEEGLQNTSLCLNNDVCLHIKDYVVIGKDQVGGIVLMDEVFDIDEEDYFLITCAQNPIPGLLTPKLIIQIKVP